MWFVVVNEVKIPALTQKTLQGRGSLGSWDERQGSVARHTTGLSHRLLQTVTSPLSLPANSPSP